MTQGRQRAGGAAGQREQSPEGVILCKVPWRAAGPRPERGPETCGSHIKVPQSRAGSWHTCAFPHLSITLPPGMDFLGHSTNWVLVPAAGGWPSDEENTGAAVGHRGQSRTVAVWPLCLHRMSPCPPGLQNPSAKDPSLQVTWHSPRLWQHPWEGAMVRKLRLGDVKLASRNPQPTWG